MKARTRWLNVILVLALLLPGVSYSTAAARPAIADAPAPQTILSADEPTFPNMPAALSSTPEWTWQNPLPQGNTLNAVWGSGPNDVFAVGDYGTILHYDGSEWQVMDSGTTRNLNGVWGSNGDNVFAVGSGGTILRYDGAVWGPMSSGTTRDLNGVWGSNASDVFVVGSYGTIRRYDGSAWYAMSSGTTNALNGVWGSAANNIFAVGSNGTIRRYNGSAWYAMNSNTTEDLQAAWGSSGSNVYAVGPWSIILRYNGSTWNVIDSSIHGVSIWGTGSNNIFVVGTDQRNSGGAALRYDGNVWREMTSSLSCGKRLTGVWGNSSIDVFAVGESGTILHYNGSTWSNMMNTAITQNNSDYLYGVWGNAPNNIFAVGGGYIYAASTILHYNGEKWTWTTNSAAHALNGIWGSGNHVFAVGRGLSYYGAHVSTILHSTGSGWAVMDSGTLEMVWLEDVWGSSSNDVFAVGSGGTILHYNGSVWQPMNSGTTVDLYGVWGTSNSNVFVVGDGGTILHYNGSVWHPLNSGTTSQLLGVWGSGPNDIFVVGGVILHHDGSNWHTISDYSASDVWGSGPNDVFAVGYDGAILHYDGSAWRMMNSGTNNTLNGVWGSGPNDVFAVGEGGAILHYSGEPKPYLTYVGSSQISGRSAFFQGEIDRRITLGDHVHLQLPFRNVGNAMLANAVVTITGALPTFGSVGVEIHNSSSWSSYQQPVTLTPSTLAPGQTGIADFWIYVTNPDPDILQATPTGTWMRVNDGNNDWKLSIALDPIMFDIAEHQDMLAGSCLHHPDDPQIQRYAQYAASAPEATSPPSNSGDPDTTEQALRNLIARVNEEFLYDRVGWRLWRVPDTVLITEREDYIGQCRHFADLTAGLSRSLGLPARYVRGNLVQDDWPGAPHMWNEVDTGGGNWQMVDATNNIVFDPFNVHWAWADRYPLSTASILTLHSCNAFCIDNNGCAACRIGFGELFPGELYGLGQGCMDNVKPTYNASLANQLFNGHLQTDLEIISLDVSAPIFVTLGTAFEVVAKATNSTTVTLDNLDIAVSPYLESGWDTPIYAINPPSHTLSSILPGQAVTVTWVVTPLLAGRPLPLQVAALSGDLEGVYEQLQNVNEPGTLPNLSLTAGCDQRTVQLGVPITLTAMIADEYLHVITDSLSTIAATVYTTPTQAFSTTFNLAYCVDCQHYAYTLTLPADAPIGRYQVEYTTTRLGYESEHITSSFFVTPVLTMTLDTEPMVLNMNDPMTLTAQIYDRGTALTQAGIYAEITTPGSVTAIPLFSSEGAVYTATLRPADLADSLGAPLLPGQWTIKAIGNYQGGMATAMQSITIRHNIYLPLILRNS